MKKILVAYFSATGVTRKVAKEIALLAKADLVEIEPKKKYSEADLDWRDISSRSTSEMKDATSRPEFVKKLDDIDSYDLVIIGFPIWWYLAPRIINSFLEAYDFKSKDIALFATSGGSNFGKTIGNLRCSVDGSANFISARIVNHASKEELQEWISSLN